MPPAQPPFVSQQWEMPRRTPYNPALYNSGNSWMPPPPESAPALVAISPTVYAENAIVINNYIVINHNSADYRDLTSTLDKLVAALEGVNDFTADVRKQLITEIGAGQKLLEAPKVDPNWIKLYLTNAIKWIAEKATSVVVTELAKRAWELLCKLIGLS
jgi:hypothetical protein